MTQTNSQSLTQLENHSEFVSRHIGPDENEIKAMLNTLVC